MFEIVCGMYQKEQDLLRFEFIIKARMFLDEAYAVAFDWAEQNGDTPEYNLRGNLIATAYGIKRIRRIVNGSTDTYKNR